MALPKIGMEAILLMANFNKGKKEYTDGTQEMVEKTEKSAGIMGKFGGALEGLAKVGVSGAVAGLVGLAAGIGTSIKAASEAQEIEAQLDAVLRATGGAAGVTKDEVLGLANALSQVTPFEDDLIVSTETMLLQFKNISEDVFPQATEMALDLATRLGTDAPSAAKLLGKALESPGEGLARLRQAGVAFTDEQEEMIKKMVESGDAAGAQKFIMDELEKSVGGAARASGETFAGKMEILKNQFGNVQEQIGAAFLPALTSVADKLVEVFADPQVQAAIQKVADWLAVNLPLAIDAVAGFIKDQLIPAFSAAWSFIQDNVIPILQTLAGWFSGEGQSSLGGFASTIQTVLGPAIAFAQQMLAVIVDWVQANWPLIQQTVQTVMAAISTVISTVLSAIQAFWNEHGAAIMAVVNNVWTIIKTVVETTINTVLAIIKAVMQAINGDWAGAWATIKATLQKVWDAIKKVVENAWEAITTLIGIGLEELGGLLETAWEKIKSIGTSIVEGIKQGISDAWDTFVSWVLGKIGSIIDSIADFLGIKSPAKATMFIGEAMAQGVALGWQKALKRIDPPRMWLPTQPLTPALAAASSSVTNSYGGDTIILNVGGAESWAMAERYVEQRRRERLNRGM